MGRRPAGARAELKERLLAVRVASELVEALDEHVAVMRTEAPWVRMTRSDAVRWLLELALRNEDRRRDARNEVERGERA